MLDPVELRAVAERFGVAPDQVRRDHLVSHVLAALPSLVPEVVFFGGTALARTHLPEGRLSEDVDLYARPRADAVRTLAESLPRALRREFPGVAWDAAPTEVREPEPAVLVGPGVAPVRVQVLDGDGYTAWPTERRAVDVRYSDVPPVTLRVPTRAAFVGMKVAAWLDRRAARDLYDLWAVAATGAVDNAAAAAYRHATGSGVPHGAFDPVPPELEWVAALAHQTARLPSAADAAAAVRAAFAALDG